MNENKLFKDETEEVEEELKLVPYTPCIPQKKKKQTKKTEESKLFDEVPIEKTIRRAKKNKIPLTREEELKILEEVKKDENKINQLLELYKPYIASKIKEYDFVLNQEDVFQEIAFILLRCVRSYDPKKYKNKFITFFFAAINKNIARIANSEKLIKSTPHYYSYKHREYIYKGAKKKAQKILETKVVLTDEEMSKYPINDIEEEDKEKDTAQLIREAIENVLDEEERMIVEMYFYKDTKLEAIGRLLGRSGTGVKEKLKKALKKIREYIEQQ